MLLERNFLLFLLFFMKDCLCNNQTIFILNAKKSVHVVSDKFLSVSLDPAVLLSGLNVSGASLLLTSNLKPAYVRLAGSSIEFLQFIEDEATTTSQITDKVLSLTITPFQRDSLNEWFINTKLVPIFVINDKYGLRGKLDTKTIFFLLGLSNKINVSCLWQFGFDSSQKQVTQYIEEIKSIRNDLNSLPSEAKIWRIVGGDISALQYTSSENFSQILRALEGVAHSVMCENKQDEKFFPQDDAITNLLSAPTKPKLSVWTTAPKNKDPISFASGILWAKQIGEAANKGFSVVFRQPRVYEFFIDTPVYWISVLHKKLMGINILDIRANNNRKADINVYAHCTKRQNNFSRRGAVTIFMVNDESIQHSVAFRILGFTQLKTIEVQAYTLTSDSPDSVNIYLNGQKLTRIMLQNSHVVFTPKNRKAKVNKYLTLDVPPKSINFFVLPDAGVQTCINSEDETNILFEGIDVDTKNNFSSDLPMKVSSRFKEEEKEEEEKKHATPVTLTHLYNETRQELEVDEKYYSSLSKHVQKEYYWKDRQLDDLFLDETTLAYDNNKNNTNTKGSAEVFQDNAKHDLIKNKFAEKKRAFLRKLTENSKLIRNDANKIDKAPNISLRQNRDRKINTAEGNISLASNELDAIILRTTKIIKDEKFGVSKFKREGGGRGGHGSGRASKGHLKQIVTFAKPIPKPIPKPKCKPKRAINMDLLREKAGNADVSGKFEISPNKQVVKTRSRDTDFALEIKKQHDKIKTDLEKLLHPKQTKSEQKLHTNSFNSVEKRDKGKQEFAAEAKKQYHKMKIDLEEILHPIATKNDKKLQICVFNSEEDYFEQSNNFDYLSDDEDDDVKSYEEFDEEFKFGLPLKQNVNKELLKRRFHGKIPSNRKLNHAPNSLLGKEFVVNIKDLRVGENTIKNLEDYFNRPQNRKYELDDDVSVEYDYDDLDDFQYQKLPTRFKRDDKHYTEADVRYYRQLMNHNIKHMRDSIRKQQRESLKLKKKMSPFQKVKPKYVKVDKVPNPLHPNLSHSLKTKNNVDQIKSPGVSDLNYSNNSANIENIKIENGMKYLKNIHRKRIGDVQGWMRLRNVVPEVNDETQRLLNLIKNELRKRRPRSLSYAKVYEPENSPNLLWESLESNVEKKKMSDKGDIMKSRKIRWLEIIADLSPVVPVIYGSLKKVTVKRFFDTNTNYIRNDFFNKDKNVENSWISKFPNAKYEEVEEALFCDLNNITVNANASTEFRKNSIKNKSKAKSKETNSSFVDDIFNFFSKLLYI